MKANFFNLVVLSALLLVNLAMPWAHADVAPPETPAEAARRERVLNSLIKCTPVANASSVYIGNIKLYELDKLSGKLKNKWLLDSPLVTNPVIADNTLFLGTNNGTVYAINESKIQWTLSTKERDGKLLWWNKILFFASGNHVIAIDALTGKQLWDNSFSSAIIYQYPVASKSTLYWVDAQGFVTAVNAYTGQKLWSTEIKYSERIYQPPVVENDTLIVCGKETGIVLLDCKTGKVLRVYSNLDNGNPEWATYKDTGAFTLDEKCFYVEGRSFNEGHFASAIDRKSGKIKWKYKPEDNPEYIPALVDDLVLIGTESGSLYALNKATGKLVWSNCEKESVIQIALPITTENNIACLATRDHIQAIDLKTGKRLWQKSNYLSSDQPLVESGIVYEITGSGKVEAINLKDGSPKWQFATEDTADWGP
jgi:outer membrane protein assembly factor BamB